VRESVGEKLKAGGGYLSYSSVDMVV